jgi:hypothetical protein
MDTARTKETWFFRQYRETFCGFYGSIRFMNGIHCLVLIFVWTCRLCKDPVKLCKETVPWKGTVDFSIIARLVLVALKNILTVVN